VKSLGITTPLRVLDLGCGDGTTAVPLAQLGADVGGMNTVHVLLRIDTFKDGMLLHMLRKGKLDKDSVNGIILIQLLHFAQQLFCRNCARNGELPAVDTQLFARLRLHVDVGRRRRIFANQNNGEAESNAAFLQSGDLSRNLAFDIFCDLKLGKSSYTGLNREGLALAVLVQS
jgi:hypothetical protein